MDKGASLDLPLGIRLWGCPMAIQWLEDGSAVSQYL